MQCPHCGKEHPDQTQFCTLTGKAIPQGNIFCPYCGKSIRTGSNFCQYCAADLRPKPIPGPKKRVPPALLAAVIVMAVLAIAMVTLYLLREPGEPLLSFLKPEEPSPTRVADSGQANGIPAGAPSLTPQAEVPAIEAPTDTPLPTEVPSLTPTPTVTLTPSSTPTASQTATLLPSFTPTPNIPRRGWIAYAYGVDNKREIYLLNPTSGEEIQVTFNDFVDEAPSFSPDNSQLVYASYRYPDGWELVVMDLDTQTETTLTKFQGQARFPRWSPVSGDDRIVFEGRSGDLGSYRYNLWIVRAETGELEQVSHYDTDSRPYWSPDGTQVVFERATRDTTRDGVISPYDNSDMYILDLASGEITQVTNTAGNNDVQYAWHPDGSRIAFVSARQDITGDGHVNLDDVRNLFTIAPDGSGESLLDLGGVHAYTPDYAQSGDQLLYLVQVRSGSNEIWVMDLRTGVRTRVSGTGPYYHPEWARQVEVPALNP